MEAQDRRRRSVEMKESAKLDGVLVGHRLILEKCAAEVEEHGNRFYAEDGDEEGTREFCHRIAKSLRAAVRALAKATQTSRREAKRTPPNRKD
jgi:hypothetical protein